MSAADQLAVTFARLRRWWAAQVSDAEIARRLGVTPRRVCQLRARLGLPSWYSGGRLNAAQRAARRAKMAAEVAARGVRSLRQLDPGAAARTRARVAARYGLPADLHLVQTQALLHLTAAPLTASALAARIGRRAGGYKAFHAPQCPHGNYLTDLARRGLVAKVPVNRGQGNRSGRGESLYVLAPLALDLLGAGRGGEAARG